MHDALTRLPDRLRFLELLENAVEAQPARLTVLFINLDRFHQINSSLGYAMSDQLLQAVAERLGGMLAPGDAAGRVGGDEFAVITRGSGEELADALRQQYKIGLHELFITASIGAAIFPDHGRDPMELLRSAELAMREVKRSGGDELRVFRAEAAGCFESVQLENALRRAIENNEFDLVYQPVVRVNGDVDGLEALLVWRHPLHGTIPPQRFIPVAEETGLIVPIGTWVIGRACRDGAAWQRKGCRKARISVNVSARQLERPDFVQVLADALAASEFKPELLELELTESCFVRNTAELARRMREIRKLGVSIAMDDFGTGYSSLSSLSRLPLDAVKIDQSFVRRLLEPEGSLPVVQSIVHLAHGMRLQVVAEGVETAAELELLRVIGCDKVQGHVHGPPLGREQAGELLAGDLRQQVR